MMRRSFILIITLAGMLSSCGVQKSLQDRPDVTGLEEIDTEREVHNDSIFTIGKNSLSKNEFGIWELYVEGDALERGLITGSLTRELMHKQEKAIMSRIFDLVPPGGYQNFLKKAVTFFNRKMHLHIPEEYKAEIYGASRFALEDYDSFAPAYVRALYLHGAHDIGHALQDLMLVGCTSFAAWDTKTGDGQLLLGRNFDFYVDDIFAEDKIAAFINPTNGYKFFSYSWGGMMGVVSGMNERGVTVTINAAKSNVPLLAKTPISLVAREILQYAGSTEEAIAIAKSREVFVSEAIMIGSASERKAIIIEMAPGNFGVYEVNNSNELVCSNHFQSAEFSEDKKNIKAIAESHSLYRFERMQELLKNNKVLDPATAVEILRNRGGLKDTEIGMGNEKAINQLLAHHAIIFKPEDNKVWVSSSPYQLGEFVTYDLKKAFTAFMGDNQGRSVATTEENIQKDDFLSNPDFTKYVEFRKLSLELYNANRNNELIPEDVLHGYLSLNPDFWRTWALVGEYYYGQQQYDKAVVYFKQALKREVTTLPDERWLQKMIRKSYRKI